MNKNTNEELKELLEDFETFLNTFSKEVDANVYRGKYNEGYINGIQTAISAVHAFLKSRIKIDKVKDDEDVPF